MTLEKLIKIIREILKEHPTSRGREFDSIVKDPHHEETIIINWSKDATNN